MSFYTMPNGTSLGGKYVTNWPQGYSVQKYRWKYWVNSSGYSMFIPENSQGERDSVHNNLQNAPGITRTVAWFGAAGTPGYIVTTVTKTPDPQYCHFGFPLDPGAQYQYGYYPADGCPGGTTDRFGSLYTDTGAPGPVDGDPDPNTQPGDNPWNGYWNGQLEYMSQNGGMSSGGLSYWLSFRYRQSSLGGETGWDYSTAGRCTGTFPHRAQQIRHCYVTVTRAVCFHNCT